MWEIVITLLVANFAATGYLYWKLDRAAKEEQQFRAALLSSIYLLRKQIPEKKD